MHDQVETEKSASNLEALFLLLCPFPNSMDTFSILKEKRQTVPWIKLTQPDYTITVKWAVVGQIEEGGMMVDQSIQIFNQRRLHLSLKYKTPDAAHQAFIDTSLQPISGRSRLRFLADIRVASKRVAKLTCRSGCR